MAIQPSVASTQMQASAAITAALYPFVCLTAVPDVFMAAVPPSPNAQKSRGSFFSCRGRVPATKLLIP